MKKNVYFSNLGGMPEPKSSLDERAVFTEAYIFIPKGCMRDIVASYFPEWEKTRGWILARPLSGHTETFSYYIMDISKDGGSKNPDRDQRVESIIFVVEGSLLLTLKGSKYQLNEGSYVFIPPETKWEITNLEQSNAKFHWVRKIFEKEINLDVPEFFVINENDVLDSEMPNDKNWKTKRFVDPTDLRHDMHLNIVSFEPGSSIPFPETHVMEHAIYIIQGRGRYYLNGDWVDVEAGDFMSLRAFCPQACIATGNETFRYLLYKNVNRQIPL
jgi:(S)-ureidoglycine aminohydrolase